MFENNRVKIQGWRDDLKEATEGRQKAKVEAVGVETLRKPQEDLQQRPGVAEALVGILTSTLSATFTAQQGLQS